MTSPLGTLNSGSGPFRYHPLQDQIGQKLDNLPFALRIMAENNMRHDQDLKPLLARDAAPVSIFPSRLILQDMLALPMLLDVMVLREEAVKRGGRAADIDMELPVDLVIDHSMTLEDWAHPGALVHNQTREFEINFERFAFFKACERQFSRLRVIPPGGGIMHQVNLEFLAQVAETQGCNGKLPIVAADIVLGADSHTPMINGLGVLGWGIGGLDAERIMFGKPLVINAPQVVGLEIAGKLSDEVTATDLALHVAELLRAIGVVGKFVELLGSGYENLTVPDRATIANMAPEYGSTCVYCPIDEQTIRYLRQTGRKPDHVALVEKWARAQFLWRDPERDREIEFEQVIRFDLGAVGRSVSGPARPEQRLDLSRAPGCLAQPNTTRRTGRVAVTGHAFDLGDDDVIIAAITSCTNTANPRNMITAGLVACKAVDLGLSTKPWVKTSLAPGSRVVAKYLRESGLQSGLDALGFHVAGFACTTCNGMSGPLVPAIEKAIKRNDLHCAAVLSGNRNFSGRIHPFAASNVLASPPLVVAYAIAGTLQKDIGAHALGLGKHGEPVFLADLWPDQTEVDRILSAFAGPDTYRDSYENVHDVSARWSALNVDEHTFQWDPNSTYVTRPPYCDGVEIDRDSASDLAGLRPLVILGDNITTDHISPSGYITATSAAGQFLLSRGVSEKDFNSFGTRRGSNDIVVRSTFSSLRLRNLMLDSREGPFTRVYPEGDAVTIFEAVERYRTRGEQLIVFAGANYGGGSSRDTAAKAPWLAGVRAVVAQGFERIHRSNLINMGIAPLEFHDGMNAQSLRLDGSEVFDLAFAKGLDSARLAVCRQGSVRQKIVLRLRLDNEMERKTFRNGGLLPEMLRQQSARKPEAGPIR